MDQPWADAHCHLNHIQLVDRIAEYLEEASSQGARWFLLGGVDPAEWRQQIQLKKRFGRTIGLTFGLHPWASQGIKKSELDAALAQLESALPQADALGELGLDFHSGKEASERKTQQDVFRTQLEIAQQRNKPIILHCVKAHNEVLEQLKSVNWSGLGIVHGFTSSIEVAQKYHDRGLMLGIGPRYLKSRGAAGFAKLNQHGFVLESDAPFHDLPLDNPLLTVPQVASELATPDMLKASILASALENLGRIFPGLF